MRSTRALVMIALSLLAGVAAVVLAMRWLGQQGVQTVQVVVAARDLDLGSVINQGMLEAAGWPRGAEPKGAFNETAPLDGRVLRTSVLRGEPISENKLAPVGSKGGLSAVIKEGKRAVTVKVNEVVGVAGFALPGNFVDVLINTPDERERPISKIVLERMLVLAVAQEASQDQTKPRVVSAVTLEVTPEEAEKLDLARSVGTLSLVLRNQVDNKPVVTEGAHKTDVLKRAELVEAKPAAAVAAPPAPPPKRPARPAVRQAAPEKDKVEVIRGLQKSSSEL